MKKETDTCEWVAILPPYRVDFSIIDKNAETTQDNGGTGEPNLYIQNFILFHGIFMPSPV